MTLEQAIDEYRKLTVIQALNINAARLEQQKKELFNKVDRLLSSRAIHDVTDPFIATLMFSEMSFLKISDSAPLAAYYYGTLTQDDKFVPEENRVAALRYRLFALFQNLGIFQRFISVARLIPIFGYKGSLNADQFFDFLIMSDAYKVWDSDLDSDILDSIKRQVVKHQDMHNQFTKAAIIKEGTKAHKALFNLLEHTLKNN